MVKLNRTLRRRVIVRVDRSLRYPNVAIFVGAAALWLLLKLDAKLFCLLCGTVVCVPYTWNRFLKLRM
jgi:hypothetical protein